MAMRREAVTRTLKKVGVRGARTAGPTDPTFYLAEWRRALVTGQIGNPYKMHVWLFRAVRTIINAAVSVPFVLRRGNVDDATEIRTGRWYDLFLKPNPVLKRREFWELTLLLYLLEGECFWVLEGAGRSLMKNEIPREMWVVGGRCMKPKLDPKTGMLVAWEFRRPGRSATGAPDKVLALHEVVFHRFIDPESPGYLRGMSPLRAALRGVKMDALAQEWNEQFFKNGADPGGILTTEQRLETDHREEIHAEWRDTYEGAHNRGKTPLLDGGLKYVPLPFTHADMGFMEQLKWGREEVFAAYGVPLWFGGVTQDLNHATAKSAERILWRNGVLPITDMLEDNCEADLFDGRDDPLEGVVRHDGEKGVWGEFDKTTVEALRGDELEKTQIGRGLLDMGYPIDEVNEHLELGMAAQPMGDVGLVPMGVAPREMVASGELAGGIGLGGLGFDDEDLDDDPDGDGGDEHDDPEPPEDPEGGEPAEPTDDLTLEDVAALVEDADTLDLTDGPVERTIYVPPPPPHALHKRTRAALLGVEAEDPYLTPEEVKEFNAKPGRSRRVRLWQLINSRVFKPADQQFLRMLSSAQHKVRKELLRWLEEQPDPRSVHGVSRGLTVAEFERFLRDLTRKWVAEVSSKSGPIYNATANAALQVLGGEIGGLTVVDVGNPEIARFIAQRTQEIKTVVAGQSDALRQVLALGIGDRKTVDELAREARDRFNMIGRHAKIVARTEVGMAANRARHVGMQAEGVEGREWITSKDTKVRRTHAALDGVIAKQGAPYPVPQRVAHLWRGPNLMHPLDPHGDPSQIIACRCVEGAVLDV